MSIANFAFASIFEPEPTVPGVFTEHVLPGDTHAGYDLAACAEAWSTGEAPVFVRIRIVSPDVAHVAALSFDGGGFGTLRSETIGPGDSVVDACGGMIRSAPHVVLLSPSGFDVASLGLGATLIETRDDVRVRLIEEELMGVSRADADIDPDVWLAARAGDPVAAGHVTVAARADLFALVCLGGRDVTVH